MFSFSDTHTEDESTDKTEAQTSSNFRGNSKLFRKEMQLSAKFCDICIYQSIVLLIQFYANYSSVKLKNK